MNDGIFDRRKSGPYKLVTLLTVISLILLVGLVLLIKPAMEGNRLQKTLEGLDVEPAQLIDALNSEKSSHEITASSLKSVEDRNQDLITGMATARDDAIQFKGELEDFKIACNAEVRSLEIENEANLNKVRQEFSAKEAEYNSLHQRIEILTQDYFLLASGAATNKCCKEKVDNPSINSYDVSNNKVFCGIGKANSLEC